MRIFVYPWDIHIISRDNFWMFQGYHIEHLNMRDIEIFVLSEYSAIIQKISPGNSQDIPGHKLDIP